MADYIQLTPDLNDVADFLDPPGGRDESLPHVSDLVHACLDAAAGRKPVLKRTVTPNGIMALGRMWESVVRGYMAQQAAEEGLVALDSVTMERDGVIGNLDQIFYRSSYRVLGETKMRFSRHTHPLDHKRWMYQVKAYLKMLKTQHAWMPVLAVTSQPPDADFRIFRLEFEQDEIDANWEMLMNMKEHLEEES